MRALYLSGLVVSAVACSSPVDSPFDKPPGVGGASATGGSGGESSGDGGESSNATCAVDGTWATFVEVGVDWKSGTIRPGAGTVRQWILSKRDSRTGEELARACGIGAHGVALGSPWFAIVDIPSLGIVNEWTGVTFSPTLFDSGSLPRVLLRIAVDSVDPANPQIGDRLTTDVQPFQFGVEGLEGSSPWPLLTDATPFFRDHDGDGHPGLTGIPFQGEVPGEPGINFSDPRLAVTGDPIPRANPLYMAIRTRAALDVNLTSCDPPRYDGKVIDGSLLIETRLATCQVSGSAEECSADYRSFLDSNFPKFQPNGTSQVVSIKVPDDTTCAQVRDMTFREELE